MDQVLIQLGLEVFRAVMKAREAAAAKGHDLEALLAAAAADNSVSIWELLGIPAPGVTPEPPPPPVFSLLYNRWLPSDPGDGALKNGDHVYGNPNPNPTQFYVNEGGPLQLGGGGAPTPANLIRVVTK